MQLPTITNLQVNHTAAGEKHTIIRKQLDQTRLFLLFIGRFVQNTLS